MIVFDRKFIEGVRNILIDEYRERYESEPSDENILKRLNEVLLALNTSEKGNR
jgi:hypothetical protein